MGAAASLTSEIKGTEMSKTQLLDRSGKPIDPATIDTFTAGLAGSAIQPQDAAYDLSLIHI